jgi:hypothetical protein
MSDKTLIFGICILLLFLVGCVNDLSSKKVINYEILEKETTKLIQNFDILILPNNITEEKIEELIIHIQGEECIKSCNIFVWDNKRAYELDGQRRNLLSMNEINQWDEKNYVFVAEHNIASQTFDTDFVWMYPLKDWYYEELKGIN